MKYLSIYGPESSMTLYSIKFKQVDAPDGRRRTSVWWVHQKAAAPGTKSASTIALFRGVAGVDGPLQFVLTAVRTSLMADWTPMYY